MADIKPITGSYKVQEDNFNVPKRIKLKWWQTALIIVKNLITNKTDKNVQKKQRGNKNV